MQSKGNAPTTEQKHYREMMRSLGCMSCRSRQKTEIHHCAGASAKHNKIDVGHWWVVPLCHECHEKIGTQRGRDMLSTEIYDFVLVGRWDLEKILYVQAEKQRSWNHPNDVQVPYDVYLAIMDYQR